MSLRDFILTEGKENIAIPRSVMRADLRYDSKLPPTYDSADCWWAKRYYLTLHVETWYRVQKDQTEEESKSARDTAIGALSNNLFGEYWTLVRSAKHAIRLGENDAAIKILDGLMDKMHVRYIEGGDRHG